MKCDRCGREITGAAHVCAATPAGEPATFVDVFLVRVEPSASRAGLESFLQELLPHLQPAQVAQLLQHLPAVILRNQPRDHAEAVSRELSARGASAHLKPIRPGRSPSPAPASPPPPAAAPVRRVSPVTVLAAGALVLALGIYFGSRRFLDPAPQPEETPPPAGPVLAPSAELSPLLSEPEAGETASADPRQTEIRGLLEKGVKEFNQKDYVASIRTMEEVLALDPEQAQAKNNLALIYCQLGWDSWKQNAFENARDLFEEGLHYQDDSACAFRGLGFAYFRLDDAETALDWLLRYFQAGGDQADAYVLISDLYHQQNDLPKAIEFLRMAAALAPDQAQLQERLAKMERELSVEGDFQEGGTRHFVVKYEGWENKAAGSLVITLLEEAYFKIGAELRHYPPQPVTAILYTDKQFQDVTHVPAWAGGAYDGKIRIPAKGLDADRETLRRILFHEYTHAVVHEWSRGRAPTWLQEGLAQTYEGGTREEVLANVRLRGGRDKLFSLAQMEAPFIRLPEPEAKLAYLESLFAVEFLRETYGAYEISALIEKLAEGKTMDQAFREATYLSYDQVNEKFLDWVTANYGTP